MTRTWTRNSWSRVTVTGARARGRRVQPCHGHTNPTEAARPSAGSEPAGPPAWRRPPAARADREPASGGEARRHGGGRDMPPRPPYCIRDDCRGLRPIVADAAVPLRLPIAGPGHRPGHRRAGWACHHRAASVAACVLSPDTARRGWPSPTTRTPRDAPSGAAGIGPSSEVATDAWMQPAGSRRSCSQPAADASGCSLMRPAAARCEWLRL